ncbi:hypothetical protein MNBD_GAMMA16-1987 [hydrothermal vent metagenome]|uniref:DUF1266 domain-containing protein n=1 Tax=hydrothermal vent metagenome TaxID=652676 RepID=A0A3B0Z2L1_9ZZZZ
MKLAKFTNPNKLTAYQLWCLSLSAPFVQYFGGLHDVFELTLSHKRKEQLRVDLNRDWKINDETSLLAVLTTFLGERNDHRFLDYKQFMSGLTHAEKTHLHSDPQLSGMPKDNYSKLDRVLNDYYNELSDVGTDAWHEARAIWLCRAGVLLGVISKKIAWELIDEIAETCASRYCSWRQFGLSYATGQQLWERDGYQYESFKPRADILSFLLFDQKSPWLHVDWEIGGLSQINALSKI